MYRTELKDSTYTQEAKWHSSQTPHAKYNCMFSQTSPKAFTKTIHKPPATSPQGLARAEAGRPRPRQLRHNFGRIGDAEAAAASASEGLERADEPH